MRLWGVVGSGRRDSALAESFLHFVPSSTLMSVVLPLFYNGHAREPGRCSPPLCFFMYLFFLRDLFFLVIPVPVIPLVPVFVIPISFMSSLLSLSFPCHLTLLICHLLHWWPETQNAQELYGKICSTKIKYR